MEPQSPMSQIQRTKLIELYRAVSGCNEQDALTGLGSMFNDKFKHPLGKATYQEAAEITSVLLQQQRNRGAQPAAPAPKEVAPEGFNAPVRTEVLRVMSEAPFSWNTYALAEDGFEEQWTIRETDSQEFINEVKGVKKYLTEHKYQPSTRRGKVQEPASQATGEAPICAIHKTPMEKRQGKNGSFWSCPKHLDDGSYCPYKPKS